ncbi:Long-chain-alcohol oxidase FAO3 [Elsinoe australis]|uniref:Glucanase n=1 Tax=Elsinoe australis TaxID=40998 RepID=A0A2P8A0H9_9PEZI|nr:Long-chain-alcohol oxidase FAO3 [Elsinoe australis]
MASLLLTASLFLRAVSAQGLSNNKPEEHPKITTYRCTKAGGCTEATNAIVLDAGAHNIRQRAAPSLGCGNWGSGPNATVCPDTATCAQNCIMDGLSVTDYANLGITTTGSSLRMDMLRDSDLTSLSPRIYLLTPDEQSYELLQLTGSEFTFTVDGSKLPCGMNSALYLSEMRADGGRSPDNPGGAAYGTGYCDAQCYVTPFLNGEANVEGKGICCPEMDIWEANGRATQVAPHPCNQTGVYGCTGDECAFGGVCDKNGCGQNPYALGDKSFYGPGQGFELDTLKPITVVTQFPADAQGKLTGYRRLYLQDGKVVKSEMNIPSFDDFGDAYCAANGAARYMDLGATEGMGGALTRGMVLAMSIWWDEGGFMNWLDSGNAGPCNATEGAPEVIKSIQPDTEVTFSDFKWGEIDSTYQLSNVTGYGRYSRRL